MKRILAALVTVACITNWGARVSAQEVEARYVPWGENEESKKVIQEHLDKIKAAVEQKKFADAAKEALWILDKGKQALPEFDNCMAVGIIDFLYILNHVHPEAKKILEKRRDKIETAFREGKGTSAQALELHTINQKFGDWGRTQELYDELGEKKSKNAQKMRDELFRYIEESLLDDNEYDKLLKGAQDGPSSLEARREALETLLTKYTSVEESTKESGKLYLCRSVGRYYEALLATGQKQEAADLAEDYLKFFPKGSNYIIFIRHAVKAEMFATARNLGKEAKKVLSESDYSETVKAAIKAIPKDKKTDKVPEKETPKKDEGKKTKKSKESETNKEKTKGDDKGKEKTKG